MNEKLTQLVCDLAAKLGVTVEHLYSVLVAQARVQGFIDVGLMVAALMPILVWAYIVRQKTKLRASPTEYDPTQVASEWSRDTHGFVWGIVAVSVFVYIVVTTQIVPEIVTCFCNPEYWAIRQIISR